MEVKKLKIKIKGMENKGKSWYDRKSCDIGTITAQLRITEGYAEITITDMILTKKLKSVFQKPTELRA